MSNYLTTRLLRMILTVWIIASLVFFATRVTGNPIDFIMPEGLDAESRRLMIGYFGLDRPLGEQ